MPKVFIVNQISKGRGNGGGVGVALINENESKQEKGFEIAY